MFKPLPCSFVCHYSRENGHPGCPSLCKTLPPENLDRSVEHFERKEHKPVNGPPPKKTLFSETPLWLQGFLCISQLLTPPNWMLEHTKWNTKGCEGRHHSFEAWTSVDKRSYSQKHQGKYGMFSLPVRCIPYDFIQMSSVHKAMKTKHSDLEAFWQAKTHLSCVFIPRDYTYRRSTKLGGFKTSFSATLPIKVPVTISDTHVCPLLPPYIHQAKISQILFILAVSEPVTRKKRHESRLT